MTDAWHRIPAPEEPLSYPEPEPYVEPEPEPEPELEPSLDHDAPLPVASPVLSALDTVDNDLATRTDSWAQAVPYGKSPPADLMDGDLPNESPVNFPTIQERGGFSQPSSASPPIRIRPFSYGSGYRSNMHSRQQSVDRRKSHSYGSPMSNLAPPPHLPQAHFYGAPDIDLPTQNRPGDGAYSFCSFDTLPSTSTKTPRAAMNVLVVGTDGAVEVLAIEDRRTRLVGQISGLNGRGLLGAFNKPVASGKEATRRVIGHGMAALKTCVRSENGEDDADCGSRRRGLAEVHQAGLDLGRGLPSVVGSFGTHSR